MKPTPLLVLFFSVSTIFVSGAPSLDAGELGKPEMSGDEFKRRIAANYGVLADREPKISEIETAILEKLAPLITQDPAAATSMLEGILADDKPVSAAFNQVLGNIYFTAGQWSAAEAQFRSAIQKFPDFQRAWNSLGTLRVQLDRYREAADALARSVELGASDSTTFGMLGYALLRQREYVAAEVAYNMALLRSPGNIQWLEGKMRILAESGRHREAIAAAEELLRKDPENLKYWRLQANAHLALGELDATARCLEISRLLGEVQADSLYLLGNIYIKRDMPEQALGAYLAALEKEPETKTSTLISVARSLIAQNEIDLTRRLMNTMRIDKDNVSKVDLLNYALIRGQLAEKDGDLPGAIEAFSDALEIDPLHSETLFRIARVYSDSGRFDKARYHLERISGSGTYEFGAQLFLSKLYIEQGMLFESLAPLRKALRINPNAEVENLYNRVRVAVQSSG